MMKAAEDGPSDDNSARNARPGDQRRLVGGRRPALAYALVGPRVVEEAAVLVEHSLQVLLIEHEHMVDTLAPDGSDESVGADWLIHGDQRPVLVVMPRGGSRDEARRARAER
jgi:hypothetical protein